jgi:hypothetical protein
MAMLPPLVREGPHHCPGSIVPDEGIRSGSEEARMAFREFKKN